MVTALTEAGGNSDEPGTYAAEGVSAPASSNSSSLLKQGPGSMCVLQPGSDPVQEGGILPSLPDPCDPRDKSGSPCHLGYQPSWATWVSPSTGTTTA